MKRIFLVIWTLIICTSAIAQILKPVKWSCAAKKAGQNRAVIFIKATVDDGWHVYSINQGEGGPVKTTFSFRPSVKYALDGRTTEPPPIKSFDKTFGIGVSYFEKSVIFKQKIKLKSAETTVKGKIEYMACNDHQCLPPETLDFSIVVK